MIRETGKVVALKSGEMWVETIQQSACNSCVAEKGCGQRLIAKVTGSTTAIRVLPGSCNIETIGLNDRVVIGIPESVIVTGTLLTYLLPLFTMLASILLINYFYNSDAVTALAALVGLLIGGAAVRFHSYLNYDNVEMQPILLERLHPTLGMIHELI